MDRPLKETVYSPDSELLSGSGHHGNGEVRVHPELGASVCQPSTRYARIPPGPLLKKGGKLPTRNSKEAVICTAPMSTRFSVTVGHPGTDHLQCRPGTL